MIEGHGVHKRDHCGLRGLISYAVVLEIVRSENPIDVEEIVRAKSYDRAIGRAVQLQPYQLRPGKRTVSIPAMLDDLGIERSHSFERTRFPNPAYAYHDEAQVKIEWQVPLEWVLYRPFELLARLPKRP